jgi:NADH:ubiquinone oxidoreductase subunit 2 (subunit N)
MLSKKLSALVAISMLTASSAAVAQSAQSLSLANSSAMRAGADAQGVSALDSRNGIGIYLIGAVVLGLIVWGIIELTKSDEGSESP